MFLIRIIVHMQKKYARRIGGIASVLLLVLLVGCGGPNTVNVASPTPTLPRISWTTFDLHLPPEALNAPVVGPLSNDTILHVSITFHVNQQVLIHCRLLQGRTWKSMPISWELVVVSINRSNKSMEYRTLL